MSSNSLLKVSLCLVTYNQENYILDALEGAFSQTYPFLEIIVSDDCSSDNTFALIQQKCNDYSGGHKILINQNKSNLGLVKHLNFVISQLASSEIIVLAAGDDISSQSRVENIVEIFDRYPNVIAVTSNKHIINNNKSLLANQKISTKSRLYKRQDLFNSYSFMVGGGVALSFRKVVTSFFGDLNDDCPTEDSTYRNRCLLLGDIYFNHNAVYYYRVHDNNMSGPQNIFKLKSRDIANQYIVDINKAFNKKLINRSEYQFLIFKVDTYILSQKIYVKIKNRRNMITTLFYRILLKCVRILYSIRLMLVR